MKAAVLSIGDEILIGQIENTNASWIARKLTDLGFDLTWILAVGDKPEAIQDGLAEIGKRADLIIVTGGLGPTKDDLTKETIASFFNRKLIYKKEIEAHIKRLFARMHYPFTDNNKSQALVPEGAIILPNFYGTAPGMWIEKDGKIFVFLPGVPFEMKHIFKEELEPRLKEKYKLPFLIRKTVSVFGIGESLLADRLKEWEAQLPDEISLAYLPSPKRIRLRLSMKSYDRKKALKLIEQQIEKLKKNIPDLTVNTEHEDLVYDVHEIFKKKKKTLSIAESCTGGHVMAGLVEQAGASKFFKGGMVTYATETKSDVLGVSKKTIEKYSVVSEEVAKEMAIKIREKFKTDIGLATTGNAGPEKGDSEAELGTCYIAIADKDSVYAYKFLFGQPREKVIQRAVSKAYELCVKALKA